MTSANYSVVRYIADPARNEALNVGVLVWNDSRFALQIDEGAVSRVIRDNPHLERDALLYLEGYLRQRITRTVPPFTKEGVFRVIAEQSGFPVLLTEPRFASAEGQDEKALSVTLERLLARVVRPPKRRGGGAGNQAAAALHRGLKPLIEDHKISRHYVIEAPRTQVPRSVDFYANHGSNVALDILNLALAKADDVRGRADQEAFKVWDLLESEQVTTFYVLPLLRSDESMADTNEVALKILQSTGGSVVTDIEDARHILTTAAAS